MTFFVERQFAALGTTDGEHVEIRQATHSDYPELVLEWCDGGRLMLCDLGPSNRPALPLLREFLESKAWALTLLQKRT